MRGHGRSVPALPGSYAAGLIGLSVSGQVGFLVALRVRELGGGFDDIGLIAGVSALVPALLAVASGAIIDRIGALRVFTAATFISVLTILTMTTFTDHRLFLLSGPVLATSTMASWTASQLYVTGLGEGIARAVHIGRFSAATNIGELTGPLMAGAAAQVLGPQRGLLVPAIYSSLFVVLGLRLLARSATSSTLGSTPGPSAPAERSTALSLLRRPPLRRALTLSTSRLWASVVFLTFVPAFLVDAGLTELTAGTAMSMTGLVATFVSPVAGRLAARAGELRVMGIALAVGAVAVMLVPFLTSMPFVFVPPILLGVANGLTLPILLSLTTAAVPPARGGTALGLRSMVNQFAATAAPLAVGPLLGSYGGTVGFLAGGAGAGVLAGLAGPAARSRAASASTSAPSAFEHQQERHRGEDHQHPDEVEEGDDHRSGVPGVGEERQHLDRPGSGGEHVTARLQPDEAQEQRDQHTGEHREHSGHERTGEDPPEATEGLEGEEPSDQPADAGLDEEAGGVPEAWHRSG